jgi:hypothetical protein
MREPLASRPGSSARIERQVCAADRDGLQGAKRSNSRSYCEYLKRCRPPEPADAHGAAIRAEGPQVLPTAVMVPFWDDCLTRTRLQACVQAQGG